MNDKGFKVAGHKGATTMNYIASVWYFLTHIITEGF